MKIIILLSLICSLNLYANNSEEKYLEAQKRVIAKRKVKLIKKIATKLVMPADVIERSLDFESNDTQINVTGYTEGFLGVCKISGEIKLKDTHATATCIDESDRVSIFFP